VEAGTEGFMSGKYAVTRAEYDEFGGESVKRWWGGNWNGELGTTAATEERETHKMDIDI